MTSQCCWNSVNILSRITRAGRRRIILSCDIDRATKAESPHRPRYRADPGGPEHSHRGAVPASHAEAGTREALSLPLSSCGRADQKLQAMAHVAVRSKAWTRNQGQNGFRAT